MEKCKIIEKEAYYANRHKYICSTDIGAIMGVNPFKSAYDVWLEKKHNAKVEMNDAMQWGVDHEEEARRSFEKEDGVFISPTDYLINENEMFACAFDGYCEDKNFLLEIKCPSRGRLLEKVKKGEIPPYYYYQMQWQLMHSMANYCVFYIWTQGDTSKVKVERNEALIEEMKQSALDFYNNYMSTDIPPPLGEKDSLNIEDVEGFKEVAEAFKENENKIKEIKNSLKPLDLTKKSLREAVLDYSDNGNCHGYGVKITYNKKGTINKDKLKQKFNLTDEQFEEFIDYNYIATVTAR